MHKALTETVFALRTNSGSWSSPSNAMEADKYIMSGRDK